jgi:hypothetical protein
VRDLRRGCPEVSHTERIRVREQWLCIMTVGRTSSTLQPATIAMSQLRAARLCTAASRATSDEASPESRTMQGPRSRRSLEMRRAASGWALPWSVSADGSCTRCGLQNAQSVLLSATNTPTCRENERRRGVSVSMGLVWLGKGQELSAWVRLNGGGGRGSYILERLVEEGSQVQAYIGLERRTHQ